jgi:alpha-amylase/alpha-mannosidase (GH57 family)
MVDEQYQILRAIVPIHCELQAAGRIEVSTTPLFHPILPLLIDTDGAMVDLPGTSRPRPFAHPEDAAAQIALATQDYARRFGIRPTGMWPAEAAVSPEAVEMLKREAIQWVATDGGVLARSGLWGYRADDPEVLCQPYRASDGDAIALFFRDADVSDGVGFRYGQYKHTQDAVQAFVKVIEDRFINRLASDDDRILTIALDGENAWGGYPEDGRPFLRALYRWLTSDPRVKAVTFSEYLYGNSDRGIEAHPHERLARVHDLATGSWIDEPGSAPGVDLGTWIGEAEENAAWNLLGVARSAYATFTGGTQAAEQARESLFAAEGSDWFWWFGGDQESRNDAEFDELFRAHLRGVYTALSLVAPEALDDFIVTHPVVWTFTHRLTAIRPTDSIAIRTNCPGRLTHEIDNVIQPPSRLVPVGGVMAGARRYQVTLGPFEGSSKRLTFRFRCEHPGCDGKAPCCAGDVQEVLFDRTRTHKVRPGAAPSDSRLT